MKKLYVVCTNDFPYQILDESVTAQQAGKYCDELSKEKNEEVKKTYPNSFIRIYVHKHLIEVIDRESIINKITPKA